MTYCELKNGSVEQKFIPDILKDEKYLQCIKLARQSKGVERYGSILINDGIVVGEGFNRAIAHLSIGKLVRPVRQGMANHAEIEAINNALLKNNAINRSQLYVAGFFPKSGMLFFKEVYTCVRCIPHMKNYGIKEIFVPTMNGWIGKAIDLASNEAKAFVHGTHQKRLEVATGNYFIKDLNLL
ncbi:MAG TPA: hypothetical protein VI819_01990 [Patescibacteria group bacterium]|nr:hypothetical protein [Patescibacteria group bacterium]